MVFNATATQEGALRTQIRLIHPPVLPLRIPFVPHWKYLDAARSFHLHVPTGFASVMFAHLPSRTMFIDKDRYLGEDWLGHWISHELGHLATNSVDEHDADKAAREFRRRLLHVRIRAGGVRLTGVPTATPKKKPTPCESVFFFPEHCGAPLNCTFFREAAPNCASTYVPPQNHESGIPGGKRLVVDFIAPSPGVVAYTGTLRRRVTPDSAASWPLCSRGQDTAGKLSMPHVLTCC